MRGVILELGLLGCILLQLMLAGLLLLGPPLRPGGVAPPGRRQPPGHTTDVEHVRARLVNKNPVVGHHHDDSRLPRRARGQLVAQPHHGLDAEVVGGLVQQQNVRLPKERGREGHAHAPAAAERAQLPAPQLLAEAEVGQQLHGPLLGGVGLDGLQLPEALLKSLDLLDARLAIQLSHLRHEDAPLHVGVHDRLRRHLVHGRRREGHLLRDVVHGHRGRHATYAPGRHVPKQRRLALAVAPDEAVPTAGGHREGAFLEQVHAAARVRQRQRADLDVAVECSLHGAQLHGSLPGLFHLRIQLRRLRLGRRRLLRPLLVGLGSGALRLQVLLDRNGLDGLGGGRCIVLGDFVGGVIPLGPLGLFELGQYCRGHLRRRQSLGLRFRRRLRRPQPHRGHEGLRRRRRRGRSLRRPRQQFPQVDFLRLGLFRRHGALSRPRTRVRDEPRLEVRVPRNRQWAGARCEVRA
mmetsp:Transcript_28913/g.77273  ORF Transcript_28913/g.77273 Transcript_28913/m.77273 type:complete len:464 (+) Transcript_28913:934-2325(+)